MTVLEKVESMCLTCGEAQVAEDHTCPVRTTGMLAEAVKLLREAGKPACSACGSRKGHRPACKLERLVRRYDAQVAAEAARAPYLVPVRIEGCPVLGNRSNRLHRQHECQSEDHHYGRGDHVVILESAPPTEASQP